MLAGDEARRLGAALAAVAELEGRGCAGEHPGPAAGAATGCAGRGRRRAEIRAGLGEEDQLFCYGFQQCVFSVRIKLNIDLRCHVIREIEKLTTTRYRH